MLCLDFETALIRPGLLAPPPVCMAFWTGRALGLVGPERSVCLLRETLRGEETVLGHNVAFDLAVACAYAPDLLPLVFDAYDAGRVHDTKVREELIDISLGRYAVNGKQFVRRGLRTMACEYSLAGNPKVKGSTGLVGRYFGKDRSADKGPDSYRLRYSELPADLGLWPAEAIRYALEDVVDTQCVFDAQALVDAPAVDAGRIINEVQQTQAAWALHLMSVWGVRTESEAVEALATGLETARAAAFGQLLRAGWYKDKSVSPTELAEGVVPDFFMPPTKAGKARPRKYVRDMAVISARVATVYSEQGREVPRTETDRISTDKDALTESGDELLQTLSDEGAYKKILETYVPALRQGTTTPINPRYGLVNTGRTSCAEPNLQNLPTGRRKTSDGFVGGVRECFVPRPGWLYCSVDLDCAELRALAQVTLKLFGKSAMAEFFQKNPRGDPHEMLGAHILGLEYDEFRALKKTNRPAYKQARDCAKVANFGIPGGQGEESLVAFARSTYGIRLEQYIGRERGESDHEAALAKAKALKRVFLQAWPEMEDYFGYIAGRIGGSRGSAVLAQLFSGRQRGGLKFCDAANTLFQGLVADGAKNACFRLARESYTDRGTVLFDNCRPGVFVHDEILSELRESVAHEAAVRKAKVLCDAVQEYIPDIPITASPALMRRWYKNAEPMFVDGRLVPWEDVVL